jgi:hypothetical protein
LGLISEIACGNDTVATVAVPVDFSKGDASPARAHGDAVALPDR